ncbi:MAG: hypothetical protein H7338_05420 [Candidatus Sericytochromatia bacterium]|nr:hypothetical protein [Candidatus Sericytochromatia bacterium]
MSNKPGEPPANVPGGDNLEIRLKGEANHTPAAPSGPLDFKDFTTQELEDGTKIIKFTKPQKLQKLIGEAKRSLPSSEEARFHGKGWIIARGGGLARIGEDGMTITYYPPEVAQLVDDLMGPQA